MNYGTVNVGGREFAAGMGRLKGRRFEPRVEFALEFKIVSFYVDGFLRGFRMKNTQTGAVDRWLVG